MMFNFIHPDPIPHTHPHGVYTIFEFAVFFSAMLIVIYAAIRIFWRMRKAKRLKG